MYKYLYMSYEIPLCGSSCNFHVSILFCVPKAGEKARKKIGKETEGEEKKIRSSMNCPAKAVAPLITFTCRYF